MFGFGKKIEMNKLDINEAYDRYLKNPNKITIICVDELRSFDDAHIVGAECFPLRLVDEFEEYYPEKDITYYIYAFNKLMSEKACKKILKYGYEVYDLGSLVAFRGEEEGIKIGKKHKKRRK